MELRDLGVGIEIDDFGTGYSSISYLRRLPIDTVKVDQTLIRDIATDRQQVTFVGAILRLIESVGLRSIVEGIETFDQMDQLRRLGCLYGQGHFFSKAVPAGELTRLLTVQQLASRGLTVAITSRPGLQRRSRQVRDSLGRLLLIPRVARLSARTPKNLLVGWNHYWSSIRSTGVGGDVLWDTGDLDEIPTYLPQLRKYLDPCPAVDRRRLRQRPIHQAAGGRIFLDHGARPIAERSGTCPAGIRGRSGHRLSGARPDRARVDSRTRRGVRDGQHLRSRGLSHPQPGRPGDHGTELAVRSSARVDGSSWPRRTSGAAR